MHSIACTVLFFVCVFSSAAFAMETLDTPLAEARSSLAAIRDIALAHESHFRNVQVRARLNQSRETIALTIRGSQCRYDLDVSQHQHSNGSIGYWLDDGKASFSFSDGLLIIDPSIGQRDEYPSQIARNFWVFQMPEFEGEMMPVSRFCAALIRYIDQGNVFGKTSTLTVTNKSPIVEIDLKMNSKDQPTIGNHLVVSLDESMNYVMTGWWEQSIGGNVVGDSLFEKHVESHYTPIAPGVYFVTNATWTQSNQGRLVAQPYELRNDLEVIDVQFGDIEVDDSYFDVHKWPPIRKGIKVVDNRITPPLEFTYDDGPFDSAVLKHALEDAAFRRPKAMSNWKGVMITLNFIAVVVGAWLWITKSRGRKAA